MIWIAAGVELTKASAGYGGWEDFGVLMVLQVRYRDTRAPALLSPAPCLETCTHAPPSRRLSPPRLASLPPHLPACSSPTPP